MTYIKTINDILKRRGLLEKIGPSWRYAKRPNGDVCEYYSNTNPRRRAILRIKKWNTRHGIRLKPCITICEEMTTLSAQLEGWEEAVRVLRDVLEAESPEWWAWALVRLDIEAVPQRVTMYPEIPLERSISKTQSGS